MNKSKIKILFLESSLDPYRGGIQRVTDIIARNLEKTGKYECYFAYWLVDYKEISDNRKLKIDVKWSDRRKKRTFLDFVEKNKINVFVNQHIFSNYIISLYSVLHDKGVKIISCYHQSPFYKLHTKRNIKGSIKEIIKNLKYGKSTDAKIYEMTDRFVLLSSSFFDDFCKEHHIVNREKLEAIPNPLSFDSSLPVSLLKEKEKIVLIVTRLEDTQKNITAALRIWKKIEPYGYNGWKLVLAGYGPDEKMITEYACSLKLQNFKFIGKINNPVSLYAKSSIFMMTSRYEGFGMTLTESLQNGCIPMVFDNFSVVHDIIRDEFNGYVIPNNDEALYSEQLYRLMSHDEVRSVMAINCIKSSDKFSQDTITIQWDNLINRVLTSSEE